MKKKVLFAISQLHKGGAESSLVNLLELLDQNVYDLDLLIMNQVPIKGTISLISKVPAYVRICDVYAEINKKSKVVRKIYRRVIDNPFVPEKAIRFVKDRKYDLAIHVGEWWTPAFVANFVSADLKMAWIHTDISDSPEFQASEYFFFNESIDRYLFVSEGSKSNACKKYTFIKNKCGLLHNAFNSKLIQEMGNEPISNIRRPTLPLVVTVANIRREKNHLLQLEAMRILKERGRDFVWWNIGFFSDNRIVSSLQEEAKKRNLSDRFLMLGAKDNPYPYVAMADTVVCASSYESWSLSITEAKILGVPVIATRTSGALEQIHDGVTGYFVDDDPIDIAEKIEKVVFDRKINQRIRDSLRERGSDFDLTTEFERLFHVEHISQKAENRILYVIDDVNYRGGAHSAAYNHIQYLIEQGKKVDIFSLYYPIWQLRNRFPTINFHTFADTWEDRLRIRRIVACFLDKNVSSQDKELRWRYWRNKKNSQFMKTRMLKYAQTFFSTYSIVCLLSEGSVFKSAVAYCSAEKKIQWVHTDYRAWRKLSEYTRKVSADDKNLWQKMDQIVVLSPILKESLGQLYPEFADKICVVGNIIHEDEIRRNSRLNDHPTLRFVSCFRFEPVKNVAAILSVIKKVYEADRSFTWTMIGDGEQWDQAREWVHENRLDHVVTFVGNQYIPYSIIKQADVFVQFSRYEGLPTTIYEALVLGVPVLSGNVGAIQDQITPEMNGWLVPLSEDALYHKLLYLLDHPSEVETCKQNLSSYHYDNDIVYAQLMDVFNGRGEKASETITKDRQFV